MVGRLMGCWWYLMVCAGVPGDGGGRDLGDAVGGGHVCHRPGLSMSVSGRQAQVWCHGLTFAVVFWYTRAWRVARSR